MAATPKSKSIALTPLPPKPVRAPRSGPMYVNTTKPHPSPIAVRLRVAKTAGCPTAQAFPEAHGRRVLDGRQEPTDAEHPDGSQNTHQDESRPPAEVVADQGAQRYPEGERNRQASRDDGECPPPLLRRGQSRGDGRGRGGEHRGRARGYYSGGQ